MCLKINTQEQIWRQSDGGNEEDTVAEQNKYRNGLRMIKGGGRRRGISLGSMSSGDGSQSSR